MLFVVALVYCLIVSRFFSVLMMGSTCVVPLFISTNYFLESNVSNKSMCFILLFDILCLFEVFLVVC